MSMENLPQSYGNYLKIMGRFKEAEKFLKSYYHFYRYKEVDTREFARFVKYYFDLKDDTLFEDWLELEK